MAQPTLSYTVWHSQRTGSTWLCKGLEVTGACACPQEWFDTANPQELLEHYHASTAADLVSIVRKNGSTANGVFGIKQGYSAHFNQLLSILRDGVADGSAARLEIWEQAFPNHHHVLMTRRNKVRLAVSWWRAIQSGEWHRRRGESGSQKDLSDAYCFDAIDQLFNESVLREAGLQEMFSEIGIVPLTVAYEDLFSEPLPTFRRVLSFLGVEDGETMLFKTDLERTADALSESWVQRYRREKQAEWREASW